MKIIKIGNKEYTFEFTFAAAEHKQLVQSMFNVMSGAYIMKNGEFDDKGEAATAMFNGASEMVADVPHIAKIGFYAGLLEHNPMTEEESNALMKQYMIEYKKSYRGVFEELKSIMETDGFFDLSGLTEIIEEMNKPLEEMEQMKDTVKKPQDHKKKSTSTKSSKTTE